MQLRLWNLHICIEKVDAKMLIGRDDLISNDVINFGTSFHVFFNVCLHSHLFLLCTDWRKSDSSVRLSRQGAKGELEAEFKFQRHSCKLSFPSCHQGARESLLEG